MIWLDNVIYFEQYALFISIEFDGDRRVNLLRIQGI